MSSRLIRHHLDLEARGNPAAHHAHGNIWAAFRDPKVYVLSFSYFCFICGVYVISFWLRTFIKEMGVTSAFHVGLLSVIPYGITAIGMILIGRRTDQTLERRWHLPFPPSSAESG